MARQLTLKKYYVHRDQLVADFECAGYEFRTTYWYEGVNFDHLIQTFGHVFVEKIVFHVIAFEINKLASLAPDTLDFGPLSHHVTPKFSAFWCQIFRHVWGQWRFENSLPNYYGPHFKASLTNNIVPAVTVQPGPVSVLLFCGGGKDSFVAAKLLERSKVSFSTLAYSSSIYGPAAVQHKLIDNLLDQTTPVVRHRQWVFDDFLDSPILSFSQNLGIKTLCAAETPSSIFASLPFVLMQGYTRVVLGHERSADTGNMIWDETGEEINHQWGKSYAAEIAIQKYVSEEIIENLVIGSILKPIHDVLIFSLLKKDAAKIKYTHSCNIQKPWCMKCPKCAYVWLNYMAYLPVDFVNNVFHKNLFDTPENQIWFRQLLGLEKHTPFECVGQPSEAKIAFELCRRKGLTGLAMEMYVQAFPNPDFRHFLPDLLSVDEEHTALPEDVMKEAVRQMKDCQNSAITELNELLKPTF